jgi:hypothetical protein
MSSRKFIVSGFVGTVALVTAGIWQFSQGTTELKQAESLVVAEQSNSATQTASPGQTPAAANQDQRTEMMMALSEGLRNRFGDQVHQPKIQIRVLEKMADFLKKMYGDQWQEHMELLVRLTFPEVAEQLLERFTKLMTYNEWVLDQKHVMQTLSDQEQRQVLWDKRRELFGEEAELIWQGQLRSEQVQDTLITLGQRDDLPMNQKINSYLQALNDIYQESGPGFIQKRQQEIMDRFLMLEGIQQDLHQMPADARHQHMRQLREAVGLDAGAIKRWDELDQVRDQRWQTGKQYMAERQKLQTQFQGPEFEKRVENLQNELFGVEADTMRAEEASGYFRFDGQQQFGLN